MPTLTAYRQAVAPKLGPFIKGDATGGSSTSQLEATAWPFKSSLAQDDLFADQFIFRPAASAGDRTRVVANNGYVPATGLLTPDQVWGVAPAVGEDFELHGAIPPVADGVNDLHALINEGLKECLVFGEFTFTVGSTLTNRHSLAVAAPWLKSPSWIYQVGFLQSGESRLERNPFHRVRYGEAKRVGGTVYLEGPTFNTTDTVYVLAIKPAYYDCRAAGGTFGEQNGLTLEADEADPETDWVAAATEMHAWGRLSDVLASGNAQRAEQKRAEAAAVFTRKQRNYFKSNEPERTFRKQIRAWGPGR